VVGAARNRERLRLNLQSQISEEVGNMPLWLVAFLTGVAFTVAVTSVGGGK